MAYADARGAGSLGCDNGERAAANSRGSVGATTDVKENVGRGGVHKQGESTANAVVESERDKGDTGFGKLACNANEVVNDASAITDSGLDVQDGAANSEPRATEIGTARSKNGMKPTSKRENDTHKEAPGADDEGAACPAHRTQ